MKREIKLKELKDGKLLFQINSNDYVPSIYIKRFYIENRNLQKVITFSMWDDFEFNAYTKDDVNELNFLFEKDDPLYMCLNKLLDNDRKITIDDDNTFDKMKKFITIEKVKDNIIIHFIGNKNCELKYQKFSIFIKNIGPDARSKMQNLDLKIRLIEFFRNCENYLLSEENKILEKEDNLYKRKRLI